MQSKTKSVAQYLKELPDNQQEAITVIRELILDNLPNGYVESMNWGMISYEIPLEIYPDTYNKQPLGIVALASQNKPYGDLYDGLMVPNQQEKLLKAYKEMGVKPNMGKFCIQFTNLEKIPLDTIVELIRDFPVDEYIKQYESVKQK